MSEIIIHKSKNKKLKGKTLVVKEMLDPLYFLVPSRRNPDNFEKPFKLIQDTFLTFPRRIKIFRSNKILLAKIILGPKRWMVGPNIFGSQILEDFWPPRFESQILGPKIF